MDDEAIERLEKKLNRASDETDLKRSVLYGTGAHAPNSWQAPAASDIPAVRPSVHLKPLELVFVGAVVFFVLALVTTTFLFFAGNNTVSTKNVDVRVSGPPQIGAGSTLSLQVVVTNKNAVPMELTDLLVEFPEGTRSASDVSVELPRVRESLGTIKPGESVNRTIRAVLFGIAGTDVAISASVEYRVPSSNAILVSTTNYRVNINESPAAISVDALQETVSGQKTTLTVSVASNAPEALTDMLLLATYPPGFSFDSSAPAPSAGKAVWDLGDIEPGGKREIKITGTFSGEDGESRVMHFAAGNKKINTDDEITAPLATSDLSLTITKPFLSAVLQLEGDPSATHAIARGREVAGTITWTNNLPIRIQNVAITLSLNGQLLDKTKVRGENGFYNSNSSSILWDRSTNPNFIDVAPGASGSQKFSFAALPAGMGVYKNQNIKLSVAVKGDRLTETNVPESLQSFAVVDALVLTDLSLRASLFHANQNAGSIPPKVGLETTYTVTWSITNTGNAVGNATASGILPPYVVFKNRFSPATEAVSYNTTRRLVSWNIGDIAVGQSKSVSFEIGITPSVSQVGLAPVLISDQEFSGVDRFVRSTVEGSVLPLTTLNASVGPADGTVVP